MTCAATPARTSPCPPAAMPQSVRLHNYSSLRDSAIPKHFLSGDHDQFAPAAQLAQMAASEPKRLVLLAGADHFFAGQLEPMQQALFGRLKEQLP